MRLLCFVLLATATFLTSSEFVSANEPVAVSKLTKYTDANTTKRFLRSHETAALEHPSRNEHEERAISNTQIMSTLTDGARKNIPVPIMSGLPGIAIKTAAKAKYAQLTANRLRKRSLLGMQRDPYHAFRYLKLQKKGVKFDDKNPDFRAWLEYTRNYAEKWDVARAAALSYSVMTQLRVKDDKIAEIVLTMREMPRYKEIGDHIEVSLIETFLYKNLKREDIEKMMKIPPGTSLSDPRYQVVESFSYGLLVKNALETKWNTLFFEGRELLTAAVSKPYPWKSHPVSP